MLAHERTGGGEPLVLLHGVGSSREAWSRVVPHLAGHHDVVAVDLPGHGGSPPLPAGTEPAPAELAAAVASFLAEVGLDSVPIAGNSLGGWVSLELALRGRARSLTLLSPAGLWARPAPRPAPARRRARPALSRIMPAKRTLLRPRVVRAVAFRTASAAPGRIPLETAVDALEAIAAAPGFKAALAASSVRRFTGGRHVDVPVTLAFASQDRILRPALAQCADELPAHTVVRPLPGCGHVPMLDRPDLVAETILFTTGQGD